MGQQAYTFKKEVGDTLSLNYLLFLPRDYPGDPQREWPLIYFLHGAGERGDDPKLLKRHGIPRIVEERPDFPFITLSPQCPSGLWWLEFLDGLWALLQQVIAECEVEFTRVYLTGMSMGGYGTWHLATAHPEHFAAIAPICGGGNPLRVCALRDVPVWAFHGAQDPVVPLSESEKMVNALRECGGDVRLTVYPELAHDSWTMTYANPELYEWFLQHRRA